MSSAVWENLVSLNSSAEPNFANLGRAADYRNSESQFSNWNHIDLEAKILRDVGPLPTAEDREGYYGEDHFGYWASGMQDMQLLIDACVAHNVEIKRYFDLGCASGRVLRHFAYQLPNIESIGADINRHHVEWCNKFLPQHCKVIHSSSIPSIPLPDNSIDAITAYSVFTHIEAFETAWLMEISRILRPGGLAWITLHTEGTLSDMTEHWPLWKPVMGHPDAAGRIKQDRTFDGDRLVLRWHNNRSYASNVFYKSNYIEKVWGRFMRIAEIKRRCPVYQDVVILIKP